VVRNVGDRLRKATTLTMKSLALGNIDMVVARQIDDESRKLLNSCQRVNAGHKLSYHGEFFPMFDLSPPYDSPTRSCAMTSPLSEKWECCIVVNEVVHEVVHILFVSKFFSFLII